MRYQVKPLSSKGNFDDFLRCNNSRGFTLIELLVVIAIIGVLLYHAGLDWIPGGFLGVDAFFVLSGYLIVGILLRGLEAGNGISFREFYARRIRRIAPALAATILLTILSAIVTFYIESVSGAWKLLMASRMLAWK